jgi:hypothetical protein
MVIERRVCGWGEWREEYVKEVIDVWLLMYGY